jgi:hypothetical protein
MSARKQAVWGLLLSCGFLAVGLLRWDQRREQHQRMDVCLRAQGSCLAASLGQEQALIDLVAKPRRSLSDRTAALALMRDLRECWRYSGDLVAQVPDGAFYRPLGDAEFWLAQAVQVGDDSLHIDPRRDPAILRAALAGLRGGLAKQRTNLQAFADECRDLPWNPTQAEGLNHWTQSLHSNP